MKNLFLTVLTAVAIVTPAASQTTQKLTASKINEYGLIYTLPVTVADVTVEAEKTVKTPGEFFRYAKKYLNIDPITEPSQQWVVKSVTVNARGVADEKEQYLVQFKSGSAPFMVLNDENFPLTVNTDNLPAASELKLPVAQAAQPTILQQPVAAQAVTEEMLQSQSSAKRAELAAAKIYELRQSRNEIISGQADQMPSDGKAMQLALDNLAQQEAALTAMFVGTVQTSTDVRTFTVEMPEGETSHMVVGRLSVLNGIVDASDLSGDPIYLDIKVTARGKLPKNEKGEVKKFPKGGLAYRIPGEADVTVTFGNDQLFNGHFDVAQYGVVFGLEPNLFTDKKSPAYVVFDGATGAIRELGSK